MLFADKLELGKPRRTKEGYMAVRAKAARAGVYDYLGREVDPEGEHFAADQVVKVYRPEAEVFAKPSVHSFLLKPITDDHPHEAVTADNWKQFAKGVNAGAMRDGDHLAFDLVIMDAAAIKAVDDGKKELSNGYACELTIGDGVAPDGTPYQATQRAIFGNHIALVTKGRAGSECSIGDAATCDSVGVDLIAQLLTDERTYSGSPDGNTNEPARRETSNPGGGLRPTQDGEKIVAKTILIDGYQFEGDAALEVAVTKLQGQLKDAIDGRAADKTAHDKALATKDAEIDDLKTKVVDQAKIDQLADAKASVVADAKKVAGDKLGETAGKSVADVRRQACAAVLGDAAVADKTDDYIEARFDTLKDGKGEQRDPVRDVLSTGVRTNTNDSGASVRDLARAAQF